MTGAFLKFDRATRAFLKIDRVTGAFLKFDRATLPFLIIDMRHGDPPIHPPSLLRLAMLLNVYFILNDNVIVKLYLSYSLSNQ